MLPLSSIISVAQQASCSVLKNEYENKSCCAGNPSAAFSMDTFDPTLADSFPNVQTYLRSLKRDVSCTDVKHAHQTSGCCADSNQTLTAAQLADLTWRSSLTDAEAAARNRLIEVLYTGVNNQRYDAWRRGLIVQNQYAGYWSTSTCASEEATQVSRGTVKCQNKGTNGEYQFNGPPNFEDYPEYKDTIATVVNGEYHSAAMAYYQRYPYLVDGQHSPEKAPIQSLGMYDLHKHMDTLRQSLQATDPVHTVHKIMKGNFYLRGANEYGSMPLVEDWNTELESTPDATGTDPKISFTVCDRRSSCPIAKTEVELYVAAINLFKDAADDVVDASRPLGNFDPMFGGDMSKWKKLANTLLLRTAMRMYTNVDARCAKGACGPYTKAELETMIQGAIAAGVLDDTDAKVYGYQLPDMKLPPTSASPATAVFQTPWYHYSTIGVSSPSFSYTPQSDILIQALQGDARLSRIASPAEPRNMVLSTTDYDLLKDKLPSSILSDRVDTFRYDIEYETIPNGLTVSGVKDAFESKMSVTKYRSVRTHTIAFKFPYGFVQEDSFTERYVRSLVCNPSWGQYGVTYDASCTATVQYDTTRPPIPWEKEELGQCATVYYTFTDDPMLTSDRLGDTLDNITFPRSVPSLPTHPPNRPELPGWLWNYNFDSGQEYAGQDKIVVNEEDLVMRNWLEATKQELAMTQPLEAWRSGRGPNQWKYVSWAGNEELAMSCMDYPEVVAYGGYSVEAYSVEDAAVSLAGTDAEKAFQINLGKIPENTYMGMPLRHRLPISNNVWSTFSRFGPEMGDVYEEYQPFGTRYLGPDEAGASNWHYTITAAETNFLLAEATVYGLIDDHGTAEELVQNGMQHSYTQFKATGTAPLPVFKRNGCTLCAARVVDKLHFIWKQKWIAVYPQVLDAWTIVRETGVPTDIYDTPNTTVYHAGVTEGRVPQRMFYGFDNNDDGKGNRKVFQPASGNVDDFKAPLWWSKAAVDTPAKHISTSLAVVPPVGCPDSPTWTGFNAANAYPCSAWKQGFSGNCDAALGAGASQDAVDGAKMNCPTACGLTEDSASWTGFNADNAYPCSAWKQGFGGNCDAALGAGASQEAITGARINCPLACCTA